MTTERIAAAIKHILDEDRRADRERIAELERDNNAVVQCCAELREAIDVYLAEIQRLTEKCAALVLEKELARGELVKLREARDAAPLRIDTDMSDPQPGKLLVVRLDASDVDHMKADTHPTVTLGFFRRQFVGFLVETPAVEVKRTPKVGDRVRFTADSNHPGIMGVVSHDLGDGAMLVSQGESASHNRPNFVAMPTEIEVIE